MSSPETLTPTPKRERGSLINHLKKYAFTLSPAFRDGRINRIDTSTTFYIPDPVANKISTPEGEFTESRDEATETQLTLAFYAFRLASEDESDKPSYDFTVQLSLKRSIDAVPKEIVPHLDEEEVAEFDNAEEDDINLIQTTTYEISQLDDRFIAVTNEIELELYGDVMYDSSTDSLHAAQLATNTQIPTVESDEGESSQLTPLRVDHPLESVVDSSDQYDDAIHKLERELAFLAILKANNLDVAMALIAPSDAAKSIRHIVRSLKTGDPGVF